ncbi:MAG: nitroreductase family protein [Planctomycetes bacterium]|nr:nitroreductase family protein [Planctomycetota bacterium]
MELIDAVRQRRSVKYYDAEHRLTEDELRHLLGHAFLAPSSFNMQNWHVVAVDDQAKQDALCEASWHQAQVKDCSVTLVLAGCLTGYTKVEQFTRNAPQKVQEMFAGMVPGFYSGNEQLQRDEAVRSISLLAQNIMLIAKDMGFDSCPMIGYDATKVSEIVGLPSDCPPLMMITVGKAVQDAQPRMGLFSFEEVVSCNSFGIKGLSGEIDDS